MSLPPIGQRPSFGAPQMGSSMGGYGGMPVGGPQQPQMYNNPQFSPGPTIQPPSFSPNMSPTLQSPTSSVQGGSIGMGSLPHRPSIQGQGMQSQFSRSPSHQTLSSMPASQPMMGQGMQGMQPQQPQQPPQQLAPQPSFGGIGSMSMQSMQGMQQPPMQGGQSFQNQMGAPQYGNQFGGQQFNNPAAQQFGGGGMMGGPFAGFGMGQMGPGVMQGGGMLKPGPGAMPRSAMPEQWRTDMLGCFEDCFTCGVGTCLPGFLYGENYQKLYGYGFACACSMYTICPCFAWCFANQTRFELRKKYNLVEEPCGDCCIHFLCSPCAVCQEAREIRIREGWVTWI